METLEQMEITSLDELITSARATCSVPYWTSRGDWQGSDTTDVPHVWRWAQLRPQLAAAARLLPMEEAERRALLFCNPGYGGKPFATSSLLGAYQLTKPGENCPVHRHTPSASRFLLEGEGGWTTVEGEKCVLSRGDVVVTPPGAWHDHGNDGSSDIVWMDVLDLPLALRLKCNFFETEYFEVDTASESKAPVSCLSQSERVVRDYSPTVYGTGGVMPRFVTHDRSTGSPQFLYKWKDTKVRLNALRDFEGSPHDGIIVEYINPVTGESAMQTLSFHMQLLRPGEGCLLHRSTASALYSVVEGSGYTEVEGKRYEWGENDSIAVPAWAWHAHVNTSANRDAVLYSVSESAALRKLGLYRREGRQLDGSIVRLD
ncbi:gentisate 1,2-dioxygenase [Paraburkholderia sp. EB58]|jgi:gentisate 1,2-dioxygenase|uniref:cupin domain-containing protein n=1 Tax=Paraburkholderia sp. EB58 TaxID=3035125 RepID=UPI003D194A46